MDNRCRSLNSHFAHLPRPFRDSKTGYCTMDKILGMDEYDEEGSTGLWTGWEVGVMKIQPSPSFNPANRRCDFIKPTQIRTAPSDLSEGPDLDQDQYFDPSSGAWRYLQPLQSVSPSPQSTASEPELWFISDNVLDRERLQRTQHAISLQGCRPIVSRSAVSQTSFSSAHSLASLAILQSTKGRRVCVSVGTAYPTVVSMDVLENFLSEREKDGEKGVELASKSFAALLGLLELLLFKPDETPVQTSNQILRMLRLDSSALSVLHSLGYDIAPTSIVPPSVDKSTVRGYQNRMTLQRAWIELKATLDYYCQFRRLEIPPSYVAAEFESARYKVSGYFASGLNHLVPNQEVSSGSTSVSRFQYPDILPTITELDDLDAEKNGNEVQEEHSAKIEMMMDLEKEKDSETMEPRSRIRSTEPRSVEDTAMEGDQDEVESMPAAESAQTRNRSESVSNPAKTASPPPFRLPVLPTPQSQMLEQPTSKKKSTSEPSKLSKEPRPVESTKENRFENGPSGQAGHDDEGSTSSSFSFNLPLSAIDKSKHFNQIDSHNLVQPGSKRIVAGNAQADLLVVMEDKNKFELEQKSSAKKTGLGPRRSSQGWGSKEGGSSPIKKRRIEKEEGSGEDGDDLVKDVNDENEEANPVSKKGRRKAKAKREITEDVEVEEEMPKKQAKVAVNKNLQNATTQDGTTQEGAVSSFDKPPKAKSVAVKSKKLRIISTGLGLDQNSREIRGLKSLGVVWTDKPQEATHLVAKGFSRTEKFLCCLPFTPFIVTKKWIDACIDAGTLVDEAPYLLKDNEKELELGDTLEAILSRAKKGKMLEGKHVYVTKGVSLEAAVMQRFITACGGIITSNDLIKQRKKIISDPTALVVSSPNDQKEWKTLADDGISIYGVEALMSAMMHQDMDRGFKPENRIDVGIPS